MHDLIVSQTLKGSSSISIEGVVQIEDAVSICPTKNHYMAASVLPSYTNHHGVPVQQNLCQQILADDSLSDTPTDTRVTAQGLYDVQVAARLRCAKFLVPAASGRIFGVVLLAHDAAFHPTTVWSMVIVVRILSWAVVASDNRNTCCPTPIRVVL